MRDLAVVGRVGARLPIFARALSGADGRRPLGLVAARLLAGLAEDVGTGLNYFHFQDWLSLARHRPVRTLQDALREARSRAAAPNRMFAIPPVPGNAWGQVSPQPMEHPQADAASADPADLHRVRLMVPGPVRAAFDETLELFRAVEGRQAGVADFIEALTAEAASEPVAGETEPVRLGGPTLDKVERALAAATEYWCALPQPEPVADDLPEAPAGQPETRLRTLLELQEAVERHLGKVLARMGDEGAWRRLGFAGLGHYAEERLGMGRTTARDRAYLARALRRLPRLRAAYEKGEIGFSAMLAIVRTIGRQPTDDATELAWVERGKKTTVKRLGDEARALARAGRPARPLSDQEWHQSLHREAGTARQRLARMAPQSPGAALVPLVLRLPRELAEAFLGAVSCARKRAHRMFSTPGEPAPLWAGLMTLLEEFVAVWDVDEGRRRPGRQVIYNRAGWRCMAPGCSSRRNLEIHHVVYRSRGGGNEVTNLICLCRFHHQMGEHDGRMRVRGRAPLDLLWSLGRGGRGGLFRNELRVQGAGTGALRCA